MKFIKENKKLIAAIITILLVLFCIICSLILYFFIYLKLPDTVLSMSKQNFESAESVNFDYKQSFNLDNNEKANLNSKVTMNKDLVQMNNTQMKIFESEYKDFTVVSTNTETYFSQNFVQNFFVIQPVNKTDWLKVEGKNLRSFDSIYSFDISSIVSDTKLINKQNLLNILKGIKFNEVQTNNDIYTYTKNFSQSEIKSLFSDYLEGEVINDFASSTLKVLVSSNQKQIVQLVWTYNYSYSNGDSINYNIELSNINYQANEVKVPNENIMNYSEFLGYADLAFGNEASFLQFTAYESLNDPFAIKFKQDTFNKLEADYIDTNQIIYKYRPVDLGFLGSGKSNFHILVCAFEQNLGKDAYKKLAFDNINLENYIIELSKTAESKNQKFDSSVYKNCITTNKYQDLYEKLLGEANSKDIISSPTFELLDSKVDVKYISGAQKYEIFKDTIEQYKSE